MISRQSILFFGLGQMGRELVRHLISSGHDITGIDPNDSAREKCKDMGLHLLQSVGEVRDRPEYVFACVPYPHDLVQIASWCNMLPDAYRPTFLINLSTIGPKASLEVEQICTNVVFVECPITGGVIRASRKEITLLCGCRKVELLEDILPLLHQIAAKVIVMRNVYDTSIAKLVNNLVSINNALGTIEALGFGLKAGIPMEMLFNALENGTANSYVLSSTLRRSLLEGDFETGFALHLALKDLRLAAQAAEELHCQMPHLEVNLRELADTFDMGYGDLVFSSVALHHGLVERRDPEAH